MKQIILFDKNRKELGYVLLDSSEGRIEAELKKESKALESDLKDMLSSVTEAQGLYISKTCRQDQKIIEAREKIDLKHPLALNALADLINHYSHWPQQVFAVIQKREEE